MDKRITTQNTGKKGDYWFLDRSRLGTRLLTLALALGVTAAGAACSSTANQSLEDPTAITDSRGTSGLLGGVLGTVTGTVGAVTGILSEKWYFDTAVVEPLLALLPLKAQLDGRNLSLKSTEVFDQVEVCFTDQTKLTLSPNALSLSFRGPYGKTIQGVVVRLKSDGSKWFFDNGKWYVDAASERWYSDVDSAPTPVTNAY
jgi:hypothetical protein